MAPAAPHDTSWCMGTSSHSRPPASMTGRSGEAAPGAVTLKDRLPLPFSGGGRLQPRTGSWMGCGTMTAPSLAGPGPGEGDGTWACLCRGLLPAGRRAPPNLDRRPAAGGPGAAPAPPPQPAATLPPSKGFPQRGTPGSGTARGRAAAPAPPLRGPPASGRGRQAEVRGTGRAPPPAGSFLWGGLLRPPAPGPPPVPRRAPLIRSHANTRARLPTCSPSTGRRHPPPPAAAPQLGARAGGSGRAPGGPWRHDDQRRLRQWATGPPCRFRARGAVGSPRARARAAPGRRRWRWRAAAPAGEAASAATGLTEPARCFARPRGPGAAGAVSPGRLPAAPPPLPGSLLAGRRRGAAPRARTGWAARPGRVAGARRPRRRGGAGGTCGPFPLRWLLVDSVAALGDPLADSGLCPQSYGKLRHAPWKWHFSGSQNCSPSLIICNATVIGTSSLRGGVPQRYWWKVAGGGRTRIFYSKEISRSLPRFARGQQRGTSAAHGCYEELDSMDAASSNGCLRWRETSVTLKRMVRPFNHISGCTTVFEACSLGSP